jgi:hypothetical protein
MNDCGKDFEEKFEKKVEEKIEKSCECDCDCNKKTNMSNNNYVYGLGVIGAAIFFMAKATSFWTGVLAILKALVWPVFMVYELLKFLIK